MHLSEKEIRIKHDVSASYIEIPKNTIQVIVNGRDMYFEESEFLTTFEQLTTLWRYVNDKYSTK